MAFELLNIKQPGIARPDGRGAEAVSYPEFYADMHGSLDFIEKRVGRAINFQTTL